MVEVREAKVVTFTIKEAADALAEKAKQLGHQIPSMVESAKIELEPQRGTLSCTFISPITIKTVGNA